ncbi:hypothetical protein V5799_021778 [Amblyomma americanum]|uniref:Uncharacterized protein n=1 Tax=Amblyomma americanum TaxID=6943 RepID=A0AAQ4FNY5_AMBAM
MEYETEKSISDQSNLTTDNKEEVQDQRCTEVLIIIVFFVLALVSAVAWAMLITALVEDKGDGLGKHGDDLLSDGTVQSEEPPVEVVAVPRRTPQRDSSTPSPTTSREVPATPRTPPPGRTTPPSTTSKITVRTTASAGPLTAGTTVTTKTTIIGDRPLNEALFCTYGTSTTANTKFPWDGLCDFIFYDSMYKNGVNTLNQTTPYSADMEVVLRQAESGGYTKTQFGLGFSFTSARTLLLRYASGYKSTIDQFLHRGVSHLGIIDCPVYGMAPSQINQVFGAISVLSRDLKPLRDRGQAAFLVVGVISFNNAWNEYFKNQFTVKNEFKPNLFISHGYQLSQDWVRTPCLTTPPTVLVKPPHRQQDIHDLHDAMRALREISAAAGAPALLLSVTMKGRWTELLANSTAKVFSQCSQKSPRHPSSSYTAVCNTEPFASTLQYDSEGYAMRAYNAQNHHMFLYDDEQAFCEKLCKARANYTQLWFGVAVFDLEYEDGDNTCSTRNKAGSFSRLKTVAELLLRFSSHNADWSPENCCSFWRS